MSEVLSEIKSLYGHGLSDESARARITALESGGIGTVKKIWTGKCETNPETSTKVVTLDNPTGFTLVDGAIIAVRFTSGNNTAESVLNVEGTGNKLLFVQTGAYSLKTLSVDPNESIYIWGMGTKFFTYFSDIDGWVIDDSCSIHSIIKKPILSGDGTVTISLA